MPMSKGKEDQNQLKEDIGEKIHTICAELNIPNPLEFTIQIMAGKDPRPITKEHKRIVDLLEEIGDAPPGKVKWKRLKRIVLALVEQRTTSLNMSTSAAKQLLEYSFAKKKAETLDVNLTTRREVVEPLTAKEIAAFEKKFKQEF